MSAQTAFEYLRENREKFPPRLPTIRLSDYFIQPTMQREILFVGPRGCGKSSWLREICGERIDGSLADAVCGFDADNAPHETREDLDTLVAKMNAMKRFRETSGYPNYRPIIVMRDSLYFRLQGRLRQTFPTALVAHLKFPVAAFNEAIAKIPVSSDALLEVFPLAFLKVFEDSHQRLVPDLAYAAILATLEQPGLLNHAKAAGIKRACAAWVEQQKDMAKWLVNIVPALTKHYRSQALLAMRENIVTRALNNNDQRGARPYGFQNEEYQDYLTASGVWQRTHKGYYKFARLYSIGAVSLKVDFTRQLLDGKFPT